MNEIEFRDVLEPLRRLRAIEPPALISRRVIATVQARMTPSPARPRRRLQVMVTVGATAAMVALMMVILTSSPSLSAAEQLQQAATRSSNYRGWVHVRCTEQQFDDQGKVKAYNPLSVDFYHEVPNGKRFKVNRQDDTVTRAELTDPVLKQHSSYSAKAGRIVLSGIREQATTGPTEVEELMPITFDVLMANIKSEGRNVKVSRSLQGGVEEFEINYPHMRSRKHIPTLQQTVVTVDPDTHLVQNVQSFFEGGGKRSVQLCAYTYGGAPLKDLHDVGVSRDVKMTDDTDKP